MRHNLLAISALLCLPGTSGLTGDAARGERLFQDCLACHSVVDETGAPVARGGRTGPNLFGVIGRHAGSVPDFHYSTSMVAAGESGLRWNETDFIVYVKDATAFLRDYLDDPDARGKMAYKLRDSQKARDVWAYLGTIASPRAE